MNPSEFVEKTLAGWEQSLFKKLEVGSLVARNPKAHQWKAPFRTLLLRESTFWRIHDLLKQSHVLYQGSHLLGARILLRSSFETLAILVYLNRLMNRLISGDLSFKEFSEKTSLLLLGSKNKTTQHSAVNIITVLGHCDKSYPGIMRMYADLSESAHPNFEGICYGYSKADTENHITEFSNRWLENYGKHHLNMMRACMIIFNAEYNDLWPMNFEAIENWIEIHELELHGLMDEAE